MGQLIECWKPFDESVSRIVLESYDLQVVVSYSAYFYLHPNMLDRLELRLDELTESPAWRRKIDEALSAIALRRELHKEFADE